MSLLRDVNHPRIAKAGQLLIHNEKAHGLVYNYVEGETLNDWSKKPQDQTQKALQMKDFVLKVLDVISYFEQRDIVHRDITPKNLLITPSGDPCVIDFGLAVMARTRTVMYGTRNFMAPERLRDDDLPNSRWDTFGLAASVLASFIPTSEWNSSSDTSLPFGESRLIDLDPVVHDLCRRLLRELQTNPLDRYGSIAEFKESISMVAERLEVSGEKVVLSWVDELIRHTLGGDGVLAKVDEFTARTKVPTLLEKNLLPRIMAGDFGVVFLCGNPGDGKTTFLNMDLLSSLILPGASQPNYLDNERDTGWTIQYGSRKFRAVYDGSQSVGNQSSDERIRRALAFSEEDPSHTSVIAMEGCSDFSQSFRTNLTLRMM